MKTLEEAKRLVPTKYKPLNDTIEVVIDVLGKHDPYKIIGLVLDRYEYSLEAVEIANRVSVLNEDALAKWCEDVFAFWLYRIENDEMWLDIARDIKKALDRPSEKICKHGLDDINLKIKDVITFGTLNNIDPIGITWSSDLGEGVYILYKDSDCNWCASSEMMDSGDDKRFIKKLLDLFVRDLTIKN